MNNVQDISKDFSITLIILSRDIVVPEYQLRLKLHNSTCYNDCIVVLHMVLYHQGSKLWFFQTHCSKRFADSKVAPLLNLILCFDLTKSSISNDGLL